ncbi:STAS domain-containing protein [Streptomyces sp. NPDC058655]|uniref:STAS domain-containing protein n=1 Tax=Streptomyces sp. NPDC058655 TaxID=3346577 RepID=UPI00365B0C19
MSDRILTVDVRSTPGAPHLLIVAGELDQYSAPSLGDALSRIPAAFAPGLVLDLSGLTYCDSTGITVLVAAYRRAEAGGTRMAIAGLNAHLTRVFGTVGLDQLFSLRPTVADAVRTVTV